MHLPCALRSQFCFHRSPNARVHRSQNVHSAFTFRSAFNLLSLHCHSGHERERIDIDREVKIKRPLPRSRIIKFAKTRFITIIINLILDKSTPSFEIEKKTMQHFNVYTCLNVIWSWFDIIYPLIKCVYFFLPDYDRSTIKVIKSETFRMNSFYCVHRALTVHNALAICVRSSFTNRSPNCV